MENIWIIAVSLLFIVIFIFWKVTCGYFKKEYAKKLRKQWGTRLFIGKVSYTQVPALHF